MITDVLKWVKANKIIYWRIIDNNDNVFAKYQSEEDNLESSLVHLEENLGFLSEGAFIIAGRQKRTDTNAELKFPFFVSKKSPTVGNANFEYFDVLNKRIFELEQERKVEKILFEKNEEIKELKEKLKKEPTKNRFDKILDNLPALALLFKPELANNPVIAGILGLSVNSNTDDTQNDEVDAMSNKQLEESLGKIQRALAEDFLPIIFKLGLIAEQNPAILRGLCSQLDQLIQK
jgi:hypothetical protein